MLIISNLQVNYGEKVVLQNVSLEVKPGEIVALIGPNGAGKSTLIRAISGTAGIKRGYVSVAGKKITGLTHREIAQMMAVVPQARQMGGAYRVRQAVMMGRTAHMGWLGRESDSDIQAVENALTQTNLLEFADRQIAKLSGGEQQRILLARALAQNAPVLLLDEPTNNLDMRHQANLLQLIKNLVKERSLTVLFAMHDLNLVSVIAHKVVLLMNGRAVKVGKPQDVLIPEVIDAAFGLPVLVNNHPETGRPVIFPESLFKGD